VIFAGLGLGLGVVMVVDVWFVVVVAVVVVVVDVDPVEVDPVVLLVLLLPVVVDPVVDVLVVPRIDSGPCPATALALIAPVASKPRNTLPNTNFRFIPAPFFDHLPGDVAVSAGAQSHSVRFK